MKSSKFYCRLALAMGLLLFSRVNAQSLATPDTIITDGRYLMGDRDSKADAREFALLDAKKKILEKAGTFVRSQDVVQNYQLTSQQIESYTLGTVKTEILEEKLIPNGSTFEMVLKVQGTINPQEVSDLLAELPNNTEMNSEIETLQQNYAVLAAELDSLKNQKNPANPTAPETRENRLADLKRTELLMQFAAETSKQKPALARLEKIAQQIPQNARQRKIASGYLGIAYFKNDQYKMAIKHLQLAIDRQATSNRRTARTQVTDPNELSLKQQALFHYYLGLSLSKTGKNKLAIRHLQLARQLSPESKRFKTER